jgi:hypothetical protein
MSQLAGELRTEYLGDLMGVGRDHMGGEHVGQGDQGLGHAWIQDAVGGNGAVEVEDDMTEVK